MLYSIIVVLLIILIVCGWIWYYQLSPHNYPCIPLHEIAFRTGDLILFKPTDNWNAPRIACWYTHIGVVYIHPDDSLHVPYIFEAMGTRGRYMLPHQNLSGIFLEPLAGRVTKYAGSVFIKRIHGPKIPDDVAREFMQLVHYAKENMYYEYSLGWNGLRKGLGLEKCNHGTNCGETVMLSLIKLGILPLSEYDIAHVHHLRNMCYLSDCTTGYIYDNPVQIVYDPFT